MVISARLVVGQTMILASLGIDPTILFDAMGFSPGSPPAGDWIPYDTAVRQWQTAVRHLSDPMLGVAVGERLPLGSLGLVFHSANASDNLGSALRRLTRYFGLASMAIEPSLRTEGNLARVEIRLAPAAVGLAPTALIEAIVTVFSRMIGAFTGGGVKPLELRFAHPSPAPPSRYEERLGVPVSFGAEAYEIVLPARELSRPVPTSDPATLAAIVQALESTAPPQAMCTDRVRQALMPFLEQGTVSIGEVARALKCSPRSLQRWLLAEGTTFAKLVDTLRRERALSGIAAPQLGLVEVAYLAGFSEPTAFFRAFRRWTGKTPAEYRRGLSSQSP
jgi:AraC-like DNA-binding protein